MIFITLSIASIVLFVTLVLGTICKSCNIYTKKNIPFQNLAIGIIAGILCYLTKVEPNLLEAIILCVISAFSAGGVYDLSRSARKRKDN